LGLGGRALAGGDADRVVVGANGLLAGPGQDLIERGLCGGHGLIRRNHFKARLFFDPAANFVIYDLIVGVLRFFLLGLGLRQLSLCGGDLILRRALFHVVALRDGLPDRRPRGLDLRLGGGDLLGARPGQNLIQVGLRESHPGLRLRDRRLRLRHSRFRVGVFQLDQRLAGFNRITLLHQNFRHAGGEPERERGVIRRDDLALGGDHLGRVRASHERLRFCRRCGNGREIVLITGVAEGGEGEDKDDAGGEAGTRHGDS